MPFSKLGLSPKVVDGVHAAGYTDVSKLAKDDKVIWRGTATQSGNKIDVAVDYQGNVVAK